jgi:hypothetical protein
MWDLTTINRLNTPEEVEKSQKLARASNCRRDIKIGMICQTLGNPPPKDTELETELCLEVARQFDEEDLTHPPHRL